MGRKKKKRSHKEWRWVHIGKVSKSITAVPSQGQGIDTLCLDTNINKWQIDISVVLFQKVPAGQEKLMDAHTLRFIFTLLPHTAFVRTVLECPFEIWEYMFTEFLVTVGCRTFFKVKLCSDIRAFCTRVSRVCTIQRQNCYVVEFVMIMLWSKKEVTEADCERREYEECIWRM